MKRLLLLGCVSWCLVGLFGCGGGDGSTSISTSSSVTVSSSSAMTVSSESSSSQISSASSSSSSVLVVPSSSSISSPVSSSSPSIAVVPEPDPQTPLLGAWVSTATCNWGNLSCDSWLFFLSDEKYFSIQTTQLDEGCQVGVEMGTYIYNQTTGLFTSSLQFDSNDHCGVSDTNEETTLEFYNNTFFYYKETASSEPTGFVKPMYVDDHQGTWVLNVGNRTEVLQLEGSRYALGIYDNGVVDVEQGNYSYDAITGEFKITALTQDKNLSKGFSGANSINFIFNTSNLTITTDLSPSEPQVFTRLQ